MRLLFTHRPVLGHFHPLVPLARAAQSAGHEVLFASGPAMAELAEHLGLQFAAAGERDPPPILTRFPEARALSGRERADFTWRNVNAGVQAEAMVPDLLALIREWQPDVLVREDTELGGCIAAERLGLPHACVQVTGHRPRLRAVIAEPLQRLRAAHGLPPDPDLAMLDRYLVLATAPPSLRDAAVVLPATTHPLRPVVFDQSGDEVLPAWVNELLARPTVYLTLGSVNSHRLDVFAPFVRGLGGHSLNLVVTVGRNGDPAALGPLPSNARAERYIPQTLLLPHCDALAFHGGSGTMYAALEHALPMVIVPLAADQPDNAVRCGVAGVARVLQPSEISSDSVCAAVLELLRDPAYRRNAAGVRAELRAMPGPDHAVWLLVRLAAERAPLVAA